MMHSSASGPLSGVLVIDLSHALAGPHASMMLGDMGARVIKVENPDGGDESRKWGPPFIGPPESRDSTYFLSCNRNKESITLDLKSEGGSRTVDALIRHADVLVENFRAGVMDSFGLSTDHLHELNPRLVVLSISGFGHDGPQAERPGYDQIAQGEAGLMSITGPDADTPTRVGVPIGDLLAGMYGAYGVVSALFERCRTGQGKVVRTSLLASIVGVHAFQGTRYTVAGEVPHASGNHHASIAPYGLFQCSDGDIQVSVANERSWQRFCGVLRIDSADARFHTNGERVAHHDDLVAVIGEALAGGQAKEWLSQLSEVGVACGEVRTFDQVYNDPQTQSQGLVIEVDHQTGGRIKLPGPAVRFDEGGRGAHEAPPTLGQHNDSIRAWLTEVEASTPS